MISKGKIVVSLDRVQSTPSNPNPSVDTTLFGYEGRSDLRCMALRTIDETGWRDRCSGLRGFGFEVITLNSKILQVWLHRRLIDLQFWTVGVKGTIFQ